MPDLSTLSIPQLAIAISLAFLPVLIWMNLLFKKDKSTRKTLVKVFLFGVFSVIPILAIQYLWILYPQFDVYTLAQQSVTNVNLGFLFTYIAIGAFEEVTKFNMLRHLHWTKVEIKSVSDAMQYIFVIALGFAFTENILYFYSVAHMGQLKDLFTAVIFRSTYTAAGHMLFSGIVGYYYAIGKFGNPVLELDHWSGKKHVVLEWAQRHLKLQNKSMFSLQKTLQGLFLGMGMHALFNFSLQMNKMGTAAAVVVFGFILVIYLSKKRTTYLVFTDEENARPSTIGKAEENVVVELMGMWMNEGKFKEVIEICDRLAKRDPDNNVVKLFRAKAIDNKKIQRVKKAIHLLFTDEEYDVEKEEMSVFERLKKTQQKKAAILQPKEISKPSVPVLAHV